MKRKSSLKFIMTFLIFTLMGIDGHQAKGESWGPLNTEEEKDYAAEKKLNLKNQKEKSILKREVAIIVAPEGYYPGRVSVFKGERVQFYVTSVGKSAGCFFLPSHNIFLAADKGKMTEGVATFDRPGKYPYFCPAGKIGGMITVLDRGNNYVSSKRTKIYKLYEDQDSSTDQWRPKDF